jgi:poly(A) polymerase
MRECLKHPVFEIIAGVIADDGLQAFVIGGYVRDLLIGRPSNDIDIVVLGSGIDLARKVAARIDKKLPVSVFKNFGTAMFRYGTDEIEFVGARRESYSRNSRKPVVENGSLHDDQQRRDFTINALAISLNRETYGQLIDPFDGLNDMDRQIIRTPLNPDVTFSDDPLRMMRAVRFATQLGYSIADETFDAIARNRNRIEIISKERIADELHKIILSPRPSFGFLLLEQSGLLELIFPELAALRGIEKRGNHGHKEIFMHSVKVLDNICPHTKNLWLRWAALVHDIGKPVTKRYSPDEGWTFHGHEFVGSKMIPQIFRNLKLPMSDQMKYVQKLVLLHLRPIVLAEDVVTDSAVRRLLFEAGDDIDDLMLLCDADITSKNADKVALFRQNYELVRRKLQEIEEKDAIRNFQPPVSGNEIIETFGVPPGRDIGVIKNAIKDAILDGVIPNEYEAAREFMMKKAAELGLKPKNQDIIP